MALLFQKEADTALYLVPREGMIAPFDLGSDWTEIRVGFFLTGCSAQSEVAPDAADETIPVGDVSDLITVGLKDSGLTLPGEAGSMFIGLKNGTSFGNNTGKFSNYVSPANPGRVGNDLFGYLATAGYVGATSVANELRPEAILFPNISTITGYCGIFAMRFVVSGRGLASQSVSVSCYTRFQVDGADYTPAALQSEMNSATFSSIQTVSWNDGASARVLPDAVWLRTPFYRNRLMIAAMRAIKYQPQ